MKTVSTGAGSTLPRAITIDYVRPELQASSGGFAAVFGEPPSLEVILQIAANLHSAKSGLPMIGVEGNRLTVMGEEEVYVKLRDLVRPQTPYTAYMAAYTSRSNWIDVRLWGKIADGDLETLVAQLRRLLSDSEIVSMRRQRRPMSLAEQLASITIRKIRPHELYDTPLWRERLLRVGIAAT